MRLFEALEDMELLALAEKRLAEADPADFISEEERMQKYTEEDLEDWEEVEFGCECIEPFPVAFSFLS